jgi:isoleucyl-tRNA synthetase
VHTAPGHGAEDFFTGQKYNLPAHVPMDDVGRYTEGLPEYRGKSVFEANPLIVDLLMARGALLGSGTLTHSYPHCWRCHKPVIFRATEQWFIEMEKPGADGPLRARALDAIHKVKWTPAWGEERLTEMVTGRPDWCISRQRMWGVPIVVVQCQKCGKRLEDVAALRHIVRTWFMREGADAWFTREAGELLPPGTACPCGSTSWVKENDILDVWFDSGSSHLAVLGGQNLPWPADMYLEGPDQYRGWFQSSLLVGVGARGGSPYKHVFTHGWTLDEKGVPMSKSLGNAMYPKEICERWGADLLRTWVASQDYHADVRMSERGMSQLSEAYRKIRNTFRYVLGNLEGFDPARDVVPAGEMLELDRWMLERTADLVARCREHYDRFEFYRVFHAIHDYCVVDLSAFYFDVLKDRLYTAARAGVPRRSAQTAIWRMGEALVRLLAPVLVFTAEETWKHMPHAPGAPESVHMALFPDAVELRAGLDAAQVHNWEKLLGVREEVLQALEPMRQAKAINSSLEARIELCAGQDLAPLLRASAPWLPALFIVSQVVVSDASPGAAPLCVVVQRAEGAKCERCWNYSTQVGAHPDYPACCERCVPVLEEIAAQA